jgi:hypothetical protein
MEFTVRTASMGFSCFPEKVSSNAPEAAVFV